MKYLFVLLNFADVVPSQQIIDARMEYWYRKITGYPQVWEAAKKEAMEGLHKVHAFFLIVRRSHGDVSYCNSE